MPIRAVEAQDALPPATILHVAFYRALLSVDRSLGVPRDDDDDEGHGSRFSLLEPFLKKASPTLLLHLSVVVGRG
ncbi:hypothetical protein SAMD00023353_1301630 [Rosellinia necatrix]|uniref:Uncharacterized protein n=1 Tax=Rosellinia necatrix TaxID=77044 RepID=A0A1S8A6S9_ROSNE|nr:hypothetical protein SAMD00023353_1301630 [Rosellinia necatrix]